MIVNIRKTLLGNQYILLGAAIAISIVFLLPPSSQRGGRSGYGPIATVNGYEIPYEEFARSLRSQQDYINALRAQYGQFADDFLREMGLGDQKKLQAHVYETLIRQTLLEQFGKTLNIQLNADYVRMTLNDPQVAPTIFASILPQGVFDEIGGINAHALQSYLRQVGMTITDFEEKVEQILKTRIALEIIDSAVYVPEFYLQERYKMSSLGKKFSIATFDLDVFVAAEKKEVLQDEELQAFFDRENAARQRYFVPEKRVGKTWELSANTYGIAISDDEVKSYYEEYKVRKYLEKPAHVQVRRIVCAAANEAEAQLAYDKIKNARMQLMVDSSRFAEIAKDISDDKDTAKNGGLVPFFAKEDRDKSFSKAAFMLQKEGDISEIFQSPDGFEIVQLVARQQPTYKSLSSVSADIKKDLMQKRFEQEFAQDMQKIARGTESMESFVQARGAKTGTTGLVALEDTKLARKLFSLNKSEGSRIGFYVEGDKGYAVELTEIHERHLPELASIKNVVTHDLYEARAVKSMQNFLEKAQKDLAAGASFKEIAALYNGKTEHTSTISPKDKEAVQKLQNRGLPVSRMMHLLQEGAAIVAQDSDHGYIVRLDGLEGFDAASFEAGKKELVRSAKRDTTRVYNDAFVASLQRNATIKPNENLNTPGK